MIALQVFASPDGAAAHLSALTSLAADCQRTQQGGSPITVAQELAGSWGQGTLWVESYRAEGAETGDDFGLGGTYTLVVRIGNAIAVSQGYGEVAPALDGPDAEVVANLRDPLDELRPASLPVHGGGLLSGRGPGPGGARGLAVRWAAARGRATTGRTR